MIAKNKKGKSFGGCVRYVLNEDSEILEAEGVMAHNETSIICDFAVQRSGRPEIKQPVGHIPIWKDPKTNEVKYDFADPRIPKEVLERKMKEFQKKIRENIPLDNQKKGRKK